MTEDGLFAFGHSKDHRPDLPQVKIMVSALDPLGMPVATDVVPGQRADNPLYVPAMACVRESLGRRGLLYVGDCKMGALETRAFIVGDAHQRIYRHRVTLGQCGIDIRGRGKKLKVNYRTTDEIRRFAVKLLESRPIDDLDGGQDDQKSYMSLMHGEPPAMHTLSSVADEIGYVKQYIVGLQSDGAALESICVVARTKRLLELYGGNLRAAGFEVYEIKRDSAEQRDRAGVRLATMHRVKELEFDHVIVVAANKAILPLDAALASADDQVTERHLETGERALLYVALTRAKKSALITASSEPIPRHVGPAFRSGTLRLALE